MKITTKIKSGWEYALDCARTTIWKDDLNKEPSEAFKTQMVISEHSPLREVVYSVMINGLKSWVSVHFVRHHQGIEKYVSTQRTDRIKTACSRDEAKQGELVNMRMTVNAQSLINISKLRLCHCASPETVSVWRGVIRSIKQIDPVVANACVPSCVYRGFCPEGELAKKNCKYSQEHINNWRKKYLKTFS